MNLLLAVAFGSSARERKAPGGRWERDAEGCLILLPFGAAAPVSPPWTAMASGGRRVEPERTVRVSEASADSRPGPPGTLVCQSRTEPGCRLVPRPTGGKPVKEEEEKRDGGSRADRRERGRRRVP
jgi:hypothetical protein